MEGANQICMARNATALTRMSILKFIWNYSVEPEGENGYFPFAKWTRANKVKGMNQKLICAGFLIRSVGGNLKKNPKYTGAPLSMKHPRF